MATSRLTSGSIICAAPLCNRNRRSSFPLWAPLPPIDDDGRGLYVSELKLNSIQ